MCMCRERDCAIRNDCTILKGCCAASRLPVSVVYRETNFCDYIASHDCLPTTVVLESVRGGKGKEALEVVIING